MLCREVSKSVVCHVCHWNAESEFVSITKMATVWPLLSAAFITYAYVSVTNQAGCQNTPITLHDSPNKGGSDVRVTDSIVSLHLSQLTTYKWQVRQRT